MDIDKYLKTVTNLNEYMNFTLDFQNKRIDLKIPFNISTILSLKNIRSIEIEYFNKCEENGGATKIVELLLRSPPSKTWGLLGGEIINLLQYWLEAIRKHLIIHNIHWWTFLKLILKFIKVISLKDNTLNKVLIEETAECLLDLATHSVPDADQRSEIIQVFNAISAESSRSIRFAYKEKLKEYFTKLSSLLASAGDLPLQHRALEGLLRWLLPRHQVAVRRAAAAEWFPTGTYSRLAVDIFLERPWHDFIKDAREFLNAQNESSDLITSVICKTFSVGNRICLSGKSDCWLDVNATTRRLSILLDPRWDALGSSVTHDAVLVSDDNTRDIELKMESQHVIIAASVLEISRVYPFSADVIAGTNSCTGVRITVSSGSDISRLDRSMRAVFGDKYKMSLDMAKISMCITPEELTNSDVIYGTEENVRCTKPPDLPKKKRSGYVLRSRNPISRNSSSTFSSSSLAQLHEKLAALPQYTFDKEAVSVCVLPELSTVPELSEPDENCSHHSSLSTIKYRRLGVSCQRIHKNDRKTSPNTSINYSEKINQTLSEIDGENSSCLLLASIPSGEESIISDTIERLPKNLPCNSHNIITLLTQEALDTATETHDSTINTGDKKTPDVPQKSPVCVNQPYSHLLQDNPLPNIHKVIEESSNDIVENTPFSWIQVKRPKYKSDKNTLEQNIELLSQEPEVVKLVHNVDAIENFFSQHVTANINGDIVISPTLARKINETSSECSEDLNQCIFEEDQSLKYVVKDIVMEQYFVADTDIVECVNSMVEKICQDLVKCATHIDSAEKPREVDSNICAKRTRRKVMQNNNNEEVLDSNAKDNSTKKNRKASSTIKLKFPKRESISSKKIPKTIKKPKKEPPFTIMSPIIERESLIDDKVRKDDDDNIMQSPKTTPLLRRKRKLYSPKDETCHEKTYVQVIETVENGDTPNTVSKLNPKTRKSNATFYKELEQERQKRIRKPRGKLLLNKPVELVSPNTSKMNQIFDSLKEVVEGEPVKLVDKRELKKDFYNYSSDSEDEYHRKTKTASIIKEVSSPAVNSSKTPVIYRSDKQKCNTVTTKEITDKKISRSVKRTRNLSTKKTIPKPTKKQTISKMPQPPASSLIDERMRGEALETLNTSLIMEHHKNQPTSPDKQPDPILIAPEMESIADNNLKPDDKIIQENKLKNKTKKTLSLKRNKDIPKANLDLTMAENDGSLSPLPGLVVETILTTQCDINDSVSDNMIQKFKDIYEGKRLPDSEANITQNLLLDTTNRINCTSSKWNISTETNSRVGRNTRNSFTKDSNHAEKKKVKRESIVVKSNMDEVPDTIHMSISDDISERSIGTMGSSHSPITAHGVFDEKPPNTNLLNQCIQPRIVEQEYLNQSIKDFFTKLTEQLHESNGRDSTESIDGSKHNENNSCSSVRSGSEKLPIVVMTRLSPEYIKSRASVDFSVVDNNASKTNLNIDSSPKSRRDCTENNKDDFIIVKDSSKTSTKNTKRVLKSAISPIKLNTSFKLRNTEVCSALPRSGDNCVKRIRNIFSSKKQRTIQSNSAMEINTRTSFKTTSQKNIATSSPISRKHSLAEKQSERSPISEASASSKVSKRKSSPILRPLKKSKYVEQNNNFAPTITDSERSLSSVNEWFRRNEPTYKADNTNLSIKDNLKNVLEKLDTTLIEIHHNTSKRFINMFVEATTQLEDLKEYRDRLQRETAADIMSNVVRIVDDKFLQLNERLKLMDDQFMKSLKKKAQVLVRDEFKQKQAMVTLLREDVQAVLDHLEKTKGSN